MSDLNEPRTGPAYFIRNRGRVLGPFSIEKLISLRARGQFSRVHEVSTDRQSWQPASALDDLIAPARPARGVAKSARQEVSNISPTGPSSAPSGAPTPSANWHYNIAGELLGPVSIMELRGMVSSAKLHPDDFVWKEGMPDWLPVSQVPELQAAPTAQMPAGSFAPTHSQFHDDGIHHNSGFAVASLILGILGLLTPVLGLIFNLLAVVFGATALKAISKSRINLGGRGMALTGLILGILGFSFWGIFLLYWFGLLAVLMARFQG